ncbi:hypothetical protein ACQJBY_009143 [Aegilops geniculata]
MTSSSSHHHDASSATSTPRAGAGSTASSNGNGNGNGGGGHHHPPPPRAQPHGAAFVRLMCSFGGRILPRPGDHQLRYVGGETRIVSVPRTTSHAVLFAALAKLAPALFVPGEPAPALRYQLPHDDLDALISVSSDDDVDNLMEELDRVHCLAATAIKPPRLRLFLFAATPDHSPAGAFGSVLSGVGDASSDQWFVDQLNAPPPGSIERGRSEASSIVSEVPDYLFGFDTTSEEPSPGAGAQPKSDAEVAQGDDDDDAPAPVLGAPLVPYVPESAPWPAPPPPYMAQPVYYVPVRPVHYLNAAGHGGYMPGPVYHIVGGGRNEGPGDLYSSGGVGGVYGVPRSMPPFRQVMFAPPPATEAYSVEGKPPEGESHSP